MNGLLIDQLFLPQEETIDQTRCLLYLPHPPKIPLSTLKVRLNKGNFYHSRDIIEAAFLQNNGAKNAQIKKQR